MAAWATAQVLRSEASYRIVFDDIAVLANHEIAERVRDILATFQGVTELRIACERPHFGAVVYVTIPEDVTLASLDARARALREKWTREGKG